MWVVDLISKWLLKRSCKFIFFIISALLGIFFPAISALALELQNTDIEWENILNTNLDIIHYYIQQTKDGGYIITGEAKDSNTDTDWNVYLAKLDPIGNLLWQKTYDGKKDDRGVFVQQTRDEGYFIIGNANNLGKGYVIKTDASGNLLWQKIIDSFDTSWGQQTRDGGYIVVGSTASFVELGDGAKFSLIKFDNSGNLLWQKVFKQIRYGEIAWFVQQARDGGFIIAGSINSSKSNQSDLWEKHDALLLKSDDKGNLLWQKIFERKGFNEATCVKQTIDGGYIVAGAADSPNARGCDVRLFKINAFGDLLWEQIIDAGGDEFNSAPHIQQTKDGGYVITGKTTKLGPYRQVGYIIKTDAFGNLLWLKNYDPKGGSVSNIQITRDGGCIIVKNKYNFDTHKGDHFFIKLKPEALGIDVDLDDVGGFKDLTGHWAAQVINKLVSLGIVSGYLDGTFKPDNIITRAEAASILTRALKLTQDNEVDKVDKLVFVDREEIPLWARGAIAAAVKKGLLKGYPVQGGVAFKADIPIARVELAVILSRIIETKKVQSTGEVPVFSDITSFPDWAKEAVNTVVAGGIISGYPDGTFRPSKPVTRAEMASMILRLMEKQGIK